MAIPNPNSNSAETDSTSLVEAELAKSGWSPAHLELLRVSLKNGDITAGSRLFSAPKELVVNWIRANLANLALTSDSAKVTAECWKTLLSDINGTTDKQPVKIEVVMHGDYPNTNIGVKVEPSSPQT